MAPIEDPDFKDLFKSTWLGIQTASSQRNSIDNLEKRIEKKNLFFAKHNQKYSPFTKHQRKNKHTAVLGFFCNP